MKTLILPVGPFGIGSQVFCIFCWQIEKQKVFCGVTWTLHREEHLKHCEVHQKFSFVRLHTVPTPWPKKKKKLLSWPSDWKVWTNIELQTVCEAHSELVALGCWPRAWIFWGWSPNSRSSDPFCCCPWFRSEMAGTLVEVWNIRRMTKEGHVKQIHADPRSIALKCRNHQAVSLVVPQKEVLIQRPEGTWSWD